MSEAIRPTSQAFRDYMQAHDLSILRPRPGAKNYRLRDERSGDVIRYARTREELVSYVESLMDLRQAPPQSPTP